MENGNMMENHGKPWKMMENHDEAVDFRKIDMDCSSAILRHQNNHLGRSSQIRKNMGVDSGKWLQCANWKITIKIAGKSSCGLSWVIYTIAMIETSEKHCWSMLIPYNWRTTSNNHGNFLHDQIYQRVTAMIEGSAWLSIAQPPTLGEEHRPHSWVVYHWGFTSGFTSGFTYVYLT